MMKNLIAIVICLLLSKVDADETQKMKRIQRECALENGIDIKRAEKLKETDKLYQDKKNRCFLKCIYAKWNLIDKDGMLNREAMKEEFDYVKNIEAILDKCNEESMKVKDVCDRVYKLQTCILEAEEAQEEVEYKDVAETCAEEMGIDAEILDRLEDVEIYKNKINKCLLKCIFTRLEYMDDYGKIDRKLWEEYYDDIKNIKSVIDNCLVKYDNETDLCEKAYKFSTCVENERN